MQITVPETVVQVLRDSIFSVLSISAAKHNAEIRVPHSGFDYPFLWINLTALCWFDNFWEVCRDCLSEVVVVGW